MYKLLTQGFSIFLHHRRAKAHFERRPLPGFLTAALGQELLAAARVDPAQALALLPFLSAGLPRWAGRDPAGLLHVDHVDEAPVHPAVRLAMS